MALATLTNENRESYNASKGFTAAKEEVTPPVEAEKVVEAEPAEPKKKHSIDERLEKMASQKREAIAQAESAKKDLEALKTRLEALEKPVKGDKPEATQFTDPVAFAEALADWKFAQKEKESAAQRLKEATEAEEKARIDGWSKRLKKFSKQVEDLDEVTEAASNMRVVDNIRNAIMDSDFGPQIYYYLAKNEEELERINALPAAKRLIAFGKLEDRMEREAAKAEEEAKPAEAPRRRVAEPPEPISTVKGIGSTTSGNIGVDGEVLNERSFRTEMRKKLYGH